MNNKVSSTKREKYIDKLSAQLKKWDRELEEFEEKNKKRLSELKQDLADRLNNLKTKRSKLDQKMDQLEGVGETTYQNIRKDAEKLWKDLKNGFSSLRKEMKK